MVGRKSLFTHKKRRVSVPNYDRSPATPSTSQRPSSITFKTHTDSPSSEEDKLCQQTPNISIKDAQRRQIIGRKRKGSTLNPTVAVLHNSISSPVSDLEQDELSRKEFPFLKARERFVSQSIVRSRWERLPETSQGKVREIFEGVGRPLIAAVVPQRDDKRRIERQAILVQLLRTLSRRLPRMPFPPGTKEWAFDLEGVLKCNRVLEQQLMPITHSVALLKAEARREKQRLEADRGELQELEKNARSEERVLRRKISKLHCLLEQQTDTDLLDGPDDIMLVDKPSGSLTNVDENLHESLRPVVDQLKNHLGSIESNAEQVEDVFGPISASTATLDAFLFQRFSTHNYATLPAL